MLSKIVRDTGISGLGEFFYVLAIYAVNVMISRFLGAEGVGVYAQAIAIVFFVSLLAQLGLDVGILRFLSLYLARRDWGHVRGIMFFASLLVLFTGVTLGGGVFAAANLLANSIFKEPQLTSVLRVFALTIPFIALRTVWLNGIQAFQRTDYRIYIGKVFVPLVSVGSIALFLHLGWYWNGVLGSTVLTAVVGGVLAYYVYLQLQKSIRGIEEEKPRLAVKEWMIFCYPLLFSQLLNLALPRATILILGYFRDSAEVGIYEIASKVTLLIQMPLDISSFIIAPMIGEMYVQGDRFRLEKLFKIVTKWIFAVSILVFLMTVLLAQPILVIFGPEFVAGVLVLYILAFGHLINVGTGAVGWMLIMSGYSKVHMLNSVLSALLTIALSFFLIPTYGVVGAAIVVSLVEIVINFARLAEVFYLVKIHPYRWDFMKPVTAGLLTLIAAYLLQREITQWSISVFWTSVIMASLIFTFYITVLFLSHWPQIKSFYPLLWDRLSQMHMSPTQNVPRR